MSLNGKRDDFTTNDLLAAARAADVKPRQAKAILGDISHALEDWPKFARQAQVPTKFITAISTSFRKLT